MKLYKSPLRYPGGKSRLLKHLAPLMPEKCNEYREPFVGGGSVFFHARSKDTAERYALNDAFTPLMDFWETVADPWQMPSLCAILKSLIADLDPWAIEIEFRKAQEYMRRPELLCSTERQNKNAYYYFIVNRCSFSGSTCSGGFSSNAAVNRLTLSSVDRIRDCHDALRHVSLFNLDFEAIIRRPGRDVFLYCDPPYMTAAGLYGINGSLHDNFDHTRLAECLEQTEHKWLLTYDDCRHIRDLYKRFNIVELPSTTYSMDNASGNTPKRVRELAIMNY